VDGCRDCDDEKFGLGNVEKHPEVPLCFFSCRDPFSILSWRDASNGDDI